MTTAIEILRARVWAMENAPYFSSALWALTFYEVPGMAKKTLGPLGIDTKWRIYYDPERCKKMETRELGSVLIHEVCHVLRDHERRVGDRQPIPWNVSADMEINDDLGQYSLPRGAILPWQYRLPANLTAEQYYDKLPRKEITPQDCGSGAHGQRCEHEKDDGRKGVKGDGDENEQEVYAGVDAVQAELIRRAVAQDIAGRAPGTVPLGMKRWAENVLQPQVDWRTLLARHIRAKIRPTAGCVDYTYKRPARRAWPQVVLPALIAYTPRVAIVVDTSGSMTEGMISQALAEVKGIAKAAGFESRVYFVDADVASTARAGQALAKQVRGGGGTDMRVGIKRALGEKEKPDVVVVVTDGFTPWPSSKPKRPLIVCLTTREGDCPGWATVVYCGEGGEAGGSDY